MKKLKFYVAAAALFCCAGAPALEITPETVIVVSETAIPAEKTAADVLRKYLKQITGHELRILPSAKQGEPRILLGNDAASGVLNQVDWKKLRPDEVLYETAGSDTLAIAGAGERGTLYAVYSLLENEFGVRFLSPDMEVVPQRKNAALNHLRYRYAPPFLYREIHGEYTIKNHDFYTKLRLNGAMCRKKIPEAFGGYYQMDMAHSLGNEFLPRKTWFKTHPEYFAWRKKSGKRENQQLCMSNPEVVAEVVRQALAVMEKEPERNFISIGNSDNNALCECDGCIRLYRKYATRGAGAWIAANAVARTIRDKYPRTRVMFQAYWSTERPPEHLKMEPNISVTLAMIDRNHGLPPSATARHDEYLRRYLKLTNGNVFFWDYYADFSNFLLPTPNTDVIAHAVRTYKKFKLHGGFVQLPFGSLGDMVDYRTWLTARLLWDPDCDAEKLEHEFFSSFYGSAAGQMLAYRDILRKARDRKPVWISCYTEKTDHWLAPKDIFRINSLFTDAKKKAAKETLPLANIRRAEAGVLLVNILRYREMADLYRQKKTPFPDRETLIRNLEALGKEFRCSAYKEWDGFGSLIRRLREKDVSPAPRAKRTASRKEAVSGTLTGIHTETQNGRYILRPDREQAAYSWMNPADGEIACVVPKELSGVRHVSVTLRAVPREGRLDDAAYVGISTPNEICRHEITGTPGDRMFRTVDLGTFFLSEGSRVWVMPGVTGPLERIEVKQISFQ